MCFFSALHPHNRMLYSWLRGSHIRPHRDNSGPGVQQGFMKGDGDVDDTGSNITYISSSTEQPSQIPGSTVMVYTSGNAPMEIAMRCLDPTQPSAPLKNYPLRVSATFEAGNGTVYLLHPFDDIWWTHGALVEASSAGCVYMCVRVHYAYCVYV